MTFLRVIQHVSTLPAFAGHVQSRVEMFSGWLVLQKHHPRVWSWSFEFILRGQVYVNGHHIPEFSSKNGTTDLAIHFGRAFLVFRRPSMRWQRFEKILSERSFPEVAPAPAVIV